MATSTNEKPLIRGPMSGGIQRKTIKFQQKDTEVDLAVNASFERIGGVEKIEGMSKLGDSVTETTSSSTTSTSTSSSSTSSSSTSSSSTTTP